MLAWGLPEAEDESFLARERELERVARRRAIDFATVERIAALTRELESLEQVRTGTERRVREEMIDALGAHRRRTPSCCTPPRCGPPPPGCGRPRRRWPTPGSRSISCPSPCPRCPAAAAATRRPPPPPPATAPHGRRLPVVAALVVGLLGSVACVAAGLPGGRRRRAGDRRPGRRRAARPPARPTGAVDQRGRAAHPRRRTRPARTARGSQPDDRMLKRTDTVRTIEERLRSARRDWGVVAGFDADPEDIDEVIRRRDPQFDLTADLVDAAPSARAVATRAPAGPGRLAVAVGVARTQRPAARQAARHRARAGRPQRRGAARRGGRRAAAHREPGRPGQAAARARSRARRRGPERAAPLHPAPPRPRRPLARARVTVLPAGRAAPASSSEPSSRRCPTT